MHSLYRRLKQEERYTLTLHWQTGVFPLKILLMRIPSLQRCGGKLLKPVLHKAHDARDQLEGHMLVAQVPRSTRKNGQSTGTKMDHDMETGSIWWYVGGCQNYGPFLGPYYGTAPSI